MLLHDNHEFLTTMKTTQGQVLRKFERKLDHVGNNRVYILFYTYRAENVIGHVKSGVDGATYERVRVGGPLPIAYLPRDPRQHCIDYPWELAQLANGPFDDFIFAMSVFVPGVLVTGYFARRNRIHARLLASGAQVWGEVIELKKTHTRNGSHNYLTLRFTLPHGREIKGRTQALSETEHTHWQSGDPIHVTYNAANPRQFTVEVRHPLEGALVEVPPPNRHETLWA